MEEEYGRCKVLSCADVSARASVFNEGMVGGDGCVLVSRFDDGYMPSGTTLVPFDCLLLSLPL